MSNSIADSFVEGILEFSSQSFDDGIYIQSKRCLIDYLGATYAGAAMNRDRSNKLMAFLDDEGASSIIGSLEKTSLLNAAFINGIHSHVAELDDGVISGIVHPGAPILSALLPVAEKNKVTGKKFLHGLITGYEVCVRIAKAIQPSHKELGYHATATCGAIGAAMAIGIMLSFSKEQLMSCLAAATTSVGGSLKVLEDQSQLKPYNVGYAALNGVSASSIGHAQYTSPFDVFSGDRGFFKLMSTEFDPSFLTEFEPESLAIQQVYVKPYAACRYCHPSIDAILFLMKEHKFDSSMIKDIEVLTYKWAVKGHDHVDINNVSSAKMSIPYSIGVTLHSGNASINEFSDDYINNNEVELLTKKVVVKVDEQMTQEFPKKSMAKVTLNMNDGKILSHLIENPKGEPSLPLTNEELFDKFIGLARFAGLTSKRTHDVLNSAWNLDDDSVTISSIL
ncbi:MAG: MmgE/PrpD family protein [Cyclobacteriaceae bacterium]